MNGVEKGSRIANKNRLEKPCVDEIETGEGRKRGAPGKPSLESQYF